MRYEYKQYRRRNLPHIHSPGATLSVTFRLAGSIPQSTLKEWKAEKLWLEQEIYRVETEAERTKQEIAINQQARLLAFLRNWFRKFEDILHQAATGPTWLRDARIAQVVTDSLHHRNGKVFRLDAYCVMSNHVHVVFKPFLSGQGLIEIRSAAPLRYESEQAPLDVIMHSLKSYTAQECNKLLKRTGAFWETESYDHEVKTEAEYHRTIKYVLNNPVKAGLVQDWRDWPWSWQRN